MTSLFAPIAIALYGGSAGLTLKRMLSHLPPVFWHYALATVACLFHLGFVLVEIAYADQNSMTMTNVLTLIAFIIAVAMLTSVRFMPNTFLLPGVYGFSALAIAGAWLIPDTYTISVAMTPGIISHITLSLLAYGCLSIAFLYALQMLFIKHRLKDKSALLLSSPLPPLVLVETVLFKLTLVGAGLLAVSLLTGFLFVESMLSTKYAHKTVLSAMALVVYVVLLGGQHFWGWRNRQVVGLTLVGITLLTLAYFGSRFVREVLL